MKFSQSFTRACQVSTQQRVTTPKCWHVEQQQTFSLWVGGKKITRPLSLKALSALPDAGMTSDWFGAAARPVYAGSHRNARQGSQQGFV